MIQHDPIPMDGSALGSQDLHVHTSMSDGDLPLERVVEIAQQLGVAVGIADHISTRNMKRFVSSVGAVERYLDALEGAPVFRAGEFCWCDELWASLPSALRERFDYRVGSNHGFWLPDGSMASPWWQTLPDSWAARPGELIDIMVRNLCDLVGSMPIEIVAHSTLLPPAVLALESDVEAWWTEEREDRFIDAVVASGIALEISNRYRLPHDRLLRKAKEAEARFSLGSDGHTDGQVARLGWAVETAARVGITEADLFIPERALAGSRS